jgi:hypothetical protein
LLAIFAAASVASVRARGGGHWVLTVFFVLVLHPFTALIMTDWEVEGVVYSSLLLSQIAALLATRQYAAWHSLRASMHLHVSLFHIHQQNLCNFSVWHKRCQTACILRQHSMYTKELTMVQSMHRSLVARFR